MNTRELCLKKAEECVLNDRNKQYGSPENVFNDVADLWRVYLRGSGRNVRLTCTDVAMMLALLKVARISANPTHKDSFVDLAGYAACAMECTAAAEGIRYIDKEGKE